MSNSQDYQKITSQMKAVLASKTFPSNDVIYIELIQLESYWKQILLSTAHGLKIYAQFIDFIVNERKNILDARPYFRLRQSVFLKNVNPYIRSNKPEKLTKHRVNYMFINWANERYKGPHLKTLKELETKICATRSDFLTRNFPLILNRIKKILHEYPNIGNVQDLVNIASSASMNAIDKYVPVTNKRTKEEKYSPVMLSSIIARLHAAIMSHFSNQQIHYYPKDKKMLMEINKLRKQNMTDAQICDKLDISEGELSRLFSGFFTTSLDEIGYSIQDQTVSVDDGVIETESKEILKDSFDKLSILEQKILKLKRLNIE